jgi:DNA-binding transcriptional LysR family regulator
MIHPDHQHRFYDPFITACLKAGAKTHVAQYAQDVQIKIWLISAGFGVAPVTATLVEIRRPGVVFRPLPPGLPPVKTMLVWRRIDASVPVVKNFLDCFNSTKG